MMKKFIFMLCAVVMIITLVAVPIMAELGEPATNELAGENEKLVNDSDPSIVYTGAFTHDQGAPANSYGTGDVHYTNVGGSIEYTFTGTGIAWIGQKVFNRGDAEVYIDGESQGIISQYDEGILYAQLVWMINGLSDGEHTIKIVNMSQYTCLDCFIVNPSFEPETEPETEPVTEPETDPETDPVTEPETEPETDPETEPETEPETDPVTDPETDPATEPETDPATAPSTEESTESEDTTGDASGCASRVSLGSLGILIAVMVSGVSVMVRRKKDI